MSTILLVEDDTTHRTLAHEIISDLGYHVTTADNAYTAISKVKEDPRRFNLILMDWEMPDMNGLDAVRSLRELQVEHNWPHIPVIAFTGNKKDGDMETCFAAGMDDYLPKGVFLPKWKTALQEKIEKWIPTPSKTAKG